MPGRSDMPKTDRRSGTDRRRNPAGSFRFHERRSGFDPRRRHPVTGYLRDRLPALMLTLLLLNGFNTFDLAMTQQALAAGAMEGNPLMRELLATSLENAAAFKLGVVILATIGVVLLRRYRRVLQAAVAATAMYAAVALYHVAGLFVLA